MTFHSRWRGKDRMGRGVLQYAPTVPVHAWPLVLVALAGLIAAACVGGPSGEAYLYVNAPLTGEMASRGQEIVGGVRLLADETNRQGGILGRRIVVRPQDDGGDEEGAVKAANRVVEAVKKGDVVAGVVGHYNSGASIPSSRILAPAGVLMVTPGSSNPLLTKQSFRTVFRVVSTDDLQGPLDARLALAQGWQRLALVHTDNAYARGLAETFRAEYRAQGGSLLLDVELPYNRLDRFLAQLPALVREIVARAPQAVFFSGDYPEGIPFLRALRESGFTGGFMSGDSVMTDAFVDELGSLAEGAILSNIQPAIDAVASPEWKAAYARLEQRRPGNDSVTGYAAAQVLIEGIKAAGAFDGRKAAEKLRSLVVKTLANGEWRSNDEGDMQVRPIWFFQVRDGHFVQIGQEQ